MFQIQYCNGLYGWGKHAFIQTKRGDIFIHAWQRRGIRTDMVDCDYYDWKRGKPWTINAYRGEYMTQYNRAKITHGAIENPVK